MYSEDMMTYQHLRQEDVASSITAAPRITQEERLQRIAALRKRMADVNIDASFVVAGTNLFYFLGIPWGATERMVGALITANECLIICPKFEDTALFAVSKLPCEYTFWEEHENPSDKLAEALQHVGCRSLAVDPACSLWQFDRIRSACRFIEVSSAEHLINPLRAVKSGNELALLTQAKQITLEVQKLAHQFLKPGIKTSEVKRFIDEAHRQLGADNGSFFCAVQFGEGTSHPHGVPGDPVTTGTSIDPD